MAEIENNQTQSKSFADFIEDMAAEYTEPTPLLCLPDEEGHPTPVFTIGSLSILTGQAKSRKTFLATFLIDKLFTEHASDDKPFVILHIDTEQSRYYLRKTIGRVYKMQMWKAGTNNAQYIPLALKTCSLNDRKPFMIDAIKHYKPDFVLLDGAKDMVRDFNDQVECGEFAETISSLCGKYNTHICSIIHENRGSEKVRGHLGAEMTNKCETIMQVELVNENFGISTVKAKECRGMRFKTFSFKITGGIPELYDATLALEMVGKEKQMTDYLLTLLEGKDYLKGTDICAMAIAAGKARNKDTVYKYLRIAVEKGLMDCEIDGNKKNYSVHTDTENEDENDTEMPF